VRLRSLPHARLSGAKKPWNDLGRRGCAGSDHFTRSSSYIVVQSNTLAFYPMKAFKDRAAAGTLLGAVDGDRMLGYILLDLPGNRVKIVHLCVGPNSRKGGIAKHLVEEVSKLHRDRLGIQLKCRRDFPASSFWPQVGFRPVGIAPGVASRAIF